MLTLEDIKPLDNNASDLTLFELDGKEWKIKDFENVLLSHPLVFRKKKMNAKEFTGQFQLAIIDLIQDMHLTEKAYEMSLKIAKILLTTHERDLTKGSTHYHSNYVNPKWSRKFERVAKYGRHIFYRQPRQVSLR